MSIRIPWNGSRCIACLRDKVLSEEHLIPEALGGRLSARFLCRDCNSSLGHRTEAAARSDPTIRLLVNSLATKIPTLAQTLFEETRHVGHIRVANLSGFVDRPALATRNPDPWLLCFSLPDLVRMKLTLKAIDNAAIRLDFPDRILNENKTGNWGSPVISLT